MTIDPLGTAPRALCIFGLVVFSICVTGLILDFARRWARKRRGRHLLPERGLCQGCYKSIPLSDLNLVEIEDDAAPATRWRKRKLLCGQCRRGAE